MGRRSRPKPEVHTVHDGRTVWEKFDFPTRDSVNMGGWYSNGDRWFAGRKTLSKPFCWTPTEPFTFGGKRFIALYPCVAFSTKNWGFIVQKLWDSHTYGRE